MTGSINLGCSVDGDTSDSVEVVAVVVVVSSSKHDGSGYGEQTKTEVSVVVDSGGNSSAVPLAAKTTTPGTNAKRRPAKALFFITW